MLTVTLYRGTLIRLLCKIDIDKDVGLKLAVTISNIIFFLPVFL